MSKDKIREIVEGSSWYEEGEWGVRDAIRDTLVNAIYQATRLDEEKVANAIHKSDHPEYKDCVDCKNARYFAETIISKQDELTKE